jgi:hypothetical protein
MNESVIAILVKNVPRYYAPERGRFTTIFAGGETGNNPKGLQDLDFFRICPILISAGLVPAMMLNAVEE